ncbi:unnamed protein product [Litomosoides sigmodontis]|uniref:Uncharacterized protein n=1 Tax=Litomosoides sigmodontis TaxID=42156 RepID=A0A3P6SQ71_LITSI|nr:unnamed protein product [Litomosoides sigmodontis]
MGGKQLKSFLCCYQSKAEDKKGKLRSPTPAYHDRTCRKEPINPDQATDLFQMDQWMTLMDERCTYKRNESPHPMEVEDLKFSDITRTLSELLVVSDSKALVLL